MEELEENKELENSEDSISEGHDESPDINLIEEISRLNNKIDELKKKNNILAEEYKKIFSKRNNEHTEKNNFLDIDQIISQTFKGAKK